MENIFFKFIQLIYKTVKMIDYIVFLIVALNTGMRIGEIIGLTWDCVDFENSIIKEDTLKEEMAMIAEME